jgi:hypothetical protein
LHALAEEAADARRDDWASRTNYACNVGTAAESARLLTAARGTVILQMIWDPANAFILGDTPYPDGYPSPSARADCPRARQGLRDAQTGTLSGDRLARWVSIGLASLARWHATGTRVAQSRNALEGPSGDKLEAQCHLRRSGCARSWPPSRREKWSPS